MNPFPFTSDEWDRVTEVTLLVTNATLADDDVLREHYWCDLLDLLDSLRRKHGGHPILLEAEADFELSPARRVDLYRKALAAALLHQLPTFSIRIALARVLSQEFYNYVAAQAELLACQKEVEQDADEDERQEWLDLYQEIQDKVS